MIPLEFYFTQDGLIRNFESLLSSHFNVFKQVSKIATGSDHADLTRFQVDRDMHLRAIERKVVQGRYTFSPFLELEIEKDEPKELRTISIATIKDTIVQRGIYQYLYHRIDQLLDDGIFGYRRGKNAHSAIKQIQQHFADGLTFVFDADLTKFFDTVDHDILMNKVEALKCVDERVTKLVFRFLKTGKIPSSQVLEHKNHRGKQSKYKPEARTVGVPQGGVLSGLLSNLYLAEFDKAIVARHRGYVRYADDFVICCETEDDCLGLKDEVSKLLPERTTLNDQKTSECVRAEQGIDFLGFRVSTHKLRVRGRNVAKFKSRISKIIDGQWNCDKCNQYNKWDSTLDCLVSRIRYKIQGPMLKDLQLLADRGDSSVSLYTRSWIGFFRIVDDVEQIRNINNWLRAQISNFMWDRHQKKITLKILQDFELPSLVNTQFKARKSKPISPAGKAS